MYKMLTTNQKKGYKKRIGISCLYALVFSENNVGEKSETGSILIGNGFSKEFKRVF